MSVSVQVRAGLAGQGYCRPNCCPSMSPGCADLLVAPGANDGRVTRTPKPGALSPLAKPPLNPRTTAPLRILKSASPATPNSTTLMLVGIPPGRTGALNSPR